MPRFAVCLLAVLATVSGCFPQSEVCAQFVACQAHYEEALSLPDSNTNRFSPDGTCWESEDLAADCSTLCEETIALRVETLLDADEDLGPCE